MAFVAETLGPGIAVMDWVAWLSLLELSERGQKAKRRPPAEIHSKSWLQVRLAEGLIGSC